MVSNGVINTVAGNPSRFFDTGDNGPAAGAGIHDPRGIDVDTAGRLYITEGCGQEGGVFVGCRIREVAAGIITTIAGNGMFGFGGDLGPASDAEFAGPVQVAVDGGGEVYVSDTQNNRVRVLTPVGASCTYSVTPTSLRQLDREHPNHRFLHLDSVGLA
jgi:DNA-binding beta-propeller fold protein YncE